jgi:hypothetical protein
MAMAMQAARICMFLDVQKRLWIIISSWDFYATIQRASSMQCSWHISQAGTHLSFPELQLICSAWVITSVFNQLSKLSKIADPHLYSLRKADNCDGERASVALEPVCFITLQPLESLRRIQPAPKSAATSPE